MISVIKGQYKEMIGVILQEIQSGIYLIQFCDGTTGVVVENNLQEVLCHD